MKYSMKSISDRSALFPRLMNFENPTSFPMAQSMMAMPMAPDCEKKPIVPLRQHVRGEGGVHVVRRVDEAQAVRAQDADALFLADLLQLLLEQRAVLARFLEPGADDDGGFDPRCRAVPERPRERAWAGMTMIARSDLFRRYRRPGDRP